MTTFKRLDSYYGERGYKRYYIFNNNEPYSLRIDRNDYRDNNIYIDEDEDTIENIIFSVEMHYYRLLKDNDLSKEEFINKFKLYEKSISTIYTDLVEIYLDNEKNKKEIYTKLEELFSKSLQDIIYEKDFTNVQNLSYNMVRINDIINLDTINVKTILSDLYAYELQTINKSLYKIKFDQLNDILISNKIKFTFLSNDIDNYIIDNNINHTFMNDLKQLLSAKIYEFINQKVQYNEESLIELYNALNISYIKIDHNNNKLSWIMRKLNCISNHYIPMDYVPKEIKELVNNNLDNDNYSYSYIKYNTDDTDLIQMNTYMIDKLHMDMHFKIL